MAVFERFLKYLKSSQFLIRYFGIIFTYRWRGESRAVAACEGACGDKVNFGLTLLCVLGLLSLYPAHSRATPGIRRGRLNNFNHGIQRMKSRVFCGLVV